MKLNEDGFAVRGEYIKAHLAGGGTVEQLDEWWNDEGVLSFCNAAFQAIADWRKEVQE